MNMSLKKIYSAVKNRLKSRFRQYVISPLEKQFIRHNQQIWKDLAHTGVEGDILMESNSVASTLIALSYFGNVLAQHFNAAIRAYTWAAEATFPRSIRKILHSMNADLFFMDIRPEQSREAEQIFRNLYPTLQTKRDVEMFRIDGIILGDLFYDSYLKKFVRPTVDIACEEFKSFLKTAIEHYVYWRDYFDGRSVKAVIVSHCVYFQYATPLRIAVARGIPAYQVNATHVYRITETHNMRAYVDFMDYPEMFSRLSDQEKQSGLAEAARRIERRFSGEVGVDMHYSSRSAYRPEYKERVIEPSVRLKILIAPHCFFDAPHAYGWNIFPDLYEWFVFLGEISKKTDYDWYIKTHPDTDPHNQVIIRELMERYPRFRLLPSDTSHHQLLKEGIDAALTIYGTIGFEYAALGKKVVTASRCNPYVRYNFTLNPQTPDELESVLMNLEHFDHVIDGREIHEYYLMRFIHNTENWIFDNYSEFLSEIGGHKEQVKPVSYKYFLAQYRSAKHDQIIRGIETFVKSGDYYMVPENFEHDFSMDLAVSRKRA